MGIIIYGRHKDETGGALSLKKASVDASHVLRHWTEDQRSKYILSIFYRHVTSQDSIRKSTMGHVAVSPDSFTGCFCSS